MNRDLLRKVEAALEALTPDGAKFSVDGLPVTWNMELTCDGSDRIMGYHCCLAPGHDGRQCFSTNKHVWFERTNK